jgi:hypothetical protein
VAGKGAAGAAGGCSGAEPALRLLRTLLRADAGMAAAVVDQGGVPVLLQLLQAPCMGALTQVRQAVLLCLSELCSAGSRAGSTAVRQAGGVGLLLKECQRWVYSRFLEAPLHTAPTSCLVHTALQDTKANPA